MILTSTVTQHPTHDTALDRESAQTVAPNRKIACYLRDKGYDAEWIYRPIREDIMANSRQKEKGEIRRKY